MKILFLDIDGVVNCAETFQRHGKYIGIDPVMAERVKRIIKETGCKVVLSSTWRLDAKSRAHVRENVYPFFDVTKSIGIGFRGEEVKEWLSRHDVDVYAILDDERDFFDDQPLFRTSWKTGITDEITNAVIEHLNGSRGK